MTLDEELDEAKDCVNEVEGVPTVQLPSETEDGPCTPATTPWGVVRHEDGKHGCGLRFCVPLLTHRRGRGVDPGGSNSRKRRSGSDGLGTDAGSGPLVSGPVEGE